MKKKCSLMSLALAFILSISTLVPATAAAASTVSVKIASHPVHLNGVTIDNAKAKYPILVYKDITYFPMTWDYSNALGLNTKWSATTGLSITSLGHSSALKQDKSGSNKAGQVYRAKLASFAIKVNDQTINNAKEVYPILQFRDITYFPMTWRFTHDFFGWNTEWNTKTGFHIHSNQQQVLSNHGIIFDDEKFIYATMNGGSILAVSKALDGSFKRLSESEQLAVQYAADSLNHFDSPPAVDVKLHTENGVLFYEESSLLSLKPYADMLTEFTKEEPDTETGMYFDGYVTELNEKLSLLTVNVYYFTHIPGPYTPFDTYAYTLIEGKAQQIADFTQSIHQVISIPQGKHWVNSFAPPIGEIDTHNFHMKAQLALVDQDGTALNLNKKLKAQDIDVLRIFEDRSIVVKAYNDRFGDTPLATDGFYRIDSEGTAVKLADFVKGIGYVDSKGHIYTANAASNTITNLSTNKSHRWWDYELYEG